MTSDPLAEFRLVIERLKKTTAALGLQMVDWSLTTVSPGKDVIHAVFALTPAAIPAGPTPVGPPGVRSDQAAVDEAFEALMGSQREFEREEKLRAAEQRMSEVEDLLGDG